MHHASLFALPWHLLTFSLVVVSRFQNKVKFKKKKKRKKKPNPDVLCLAESCVLVSLTLLPGRSPNAPDLLSEHPPQMNHLEVTLCILKHGFFSLFFFFFASSHLLNLSYAQSANAFAACLIFISISFPPLSLFLSLTFLSPPPPPFWLVEDVSNLTASDVMNRVNLGYLQGNVCTRWAIFKYSIMDSSLRTQAMALKYCIGHAFDF